MTEKSDRLVIGLVGQRGHGKDYVAKYLRSKYHFYSYALADALKRDASTQYNIPLRYFYNRTRKIAVLPIYGRSPVQMLQALGDIRLSTNVNYFTDIIDSKIVKNPKNIVISDIRFKHEAEWIREYPNSKLIRIINPILPVNADLHRSETELCGIECDVILHNDPTVKDQTHERLDQLLATMF